MHQLPGRIPYTAVANSEKLIDKGDNTHFDAASAEEFGKCFAKKMKQLQKKIK